MRTTVEGVIGLLGVGLSLAICLLALAFIVVYLFARVKFFKKCGKVGWYAIIPFYGTYIEYTEIAGLHWAWAAACIAVNVLSISNATVRVLRLFVSAMSFYNIGLRGRKDPIPTMIFGALFPEVMTIIHGFGDYAYDGSIPVKLSGLF